MHDPATWQKEDVERWLIGGLAYFARRRDTGHDFGLVWQCGKIVNYLHEIAHITGIELGDDDRAVAPWLRKPAP